MDCGVGMGALSSVQLESPDWGAGCFVRSYLVTSLRASVGLEQETGKTDYINKCIRGIEYNGFSHL